VGTFSPPIAQCGVNPTPAPAPAQVPKTYEVVNQAHGLCLDAAAQPDGNSGGKIQLSSWLDNSNQRWVRRGNELVNQAHGLCLDAAAQTDANNGGPRITGRSNRVGPPGYPYSHDLTLDLLIPT
jgi:Ricin-type beta-trefoil lectin domain-like